MSDRGNSTYSKWFIFLLASVITITPLSIDMYLPAMPQIAQSLNSHIGSLQQSLSIFLGAYGAGMLLFGPLADSIGRRPLALFGLSGFTLASIALVFSQTIESFLIMRAMQAFSGAAATVVIPGMVRHIYQEHTAKGMSYLSMIMMLAPLLAPGIGSFILWLSDWRSIFIVLATYGGLILFAVWKFFPATETQQNKTRFKAAEFFGGYKIVFAHSRARPFIISMICGSFAFFCYITAIPFVYMNFFGVNEQVFSLLFGLNVSLLILASFINSRLVSHFGAMFMLRAGLLMALVSVLALFIVTVFHMPIIFTVVTITPLMAGLSLIGINSDALVIIKFPHNSGTATAVTGTLRFGSGALAGPLLVYFYDGSPLPFAYLMAAGVIGVLICQLWIWLTQTRHHSEYA